MTRREWLLGASSMAAARARRPNVLLIMTDQQSGSVMSAAGNPWLRTPHLDALAKGGTRFVNTWCTSPVCSPARSSLITGCFPHTTHVNYNGDQLNPDVPTLGEIFRGAGYETAWAGKWHLPATSPNLRVAGGKVHEPEDDRGFSFLPFELPEARLAAFGNSLDGPVAQAAGAFIRQKREKPFLLGVSLLNPHDICYWVSGGLPENHPARLEKAPPESELPPLPANFARAADEPEFIARCRERDHYGDENRFTGAWDSNHWRRYLWAYYRMAERADRSIGVVLDALRDAGLENDTIVVFTSDHGEGMAAHHWVVKLMLWQETLTVPLILRWKNGIARRTDNRTLVSVADVAPTLCELAGVPTPKPMQGVSLRPVVQGKSGPQPSSVFAELAPDTTNKALQGRAVRSRKYKYVSFSRGTNPEMLFDLENDPGETTNLASRPEHGEELERQRTLLADWATKTGDSYKL